MSEHISPIPSRIYNAAVGGHVCGPEDVDFGQKVVHLVKYDKAGNEVSFESQVTQANKIYIIHDDFVLSSNVTIPANCVLEFDGGSIAGGNININGTTVIKSSAQCFNNIAFSGIYSGVFDLKWIGIYGNNPNNSTLLNTLYTIVGSGIKTFSISGDVYFSSNEINLPAFIRIYGNKCARFIFTSTQGDYCISMSKQTELYDLELKIEQNPSSGIYEGCVVLLNTNLRDNTRNIIQPNDNVILDNVLITGRWFSDKTLIKGTGIKILCSNETYKDDFNYITGCFFRNVNISWFEYGIDYKNHNLNDETSTNYAWSNDIVFENTYLSFSNIGYRQITIEDATHNPTNSVTPIQFSGHYIAQSLLGSSINFYIDGGSTYVTSLEKWDNQTLGIIKKGLLCIMSQTVGMRSSDPTEVTDEYGTYTIQNGCKVYKPYGYLSYASGIDRSSLIDIQSVDYSHQSGSKKFRIHGGKYGLSIHNNYNSLSNIYHCGSIATILDNDKFWIKKYAHLNQYDEFITSNKHDLLSKPVGKTNRYIIFRDRYELWSTFRNNIRSFIFQYNTVLYEILITNKLEQDVIYNVPITFTCIDGNTSKAIDVFKTDHPTYSFDSVGVFGSMNILEYSRFEYTATNNVVVKLKGNGSTYNRIYVLLKQNQEVGLSAIEDVEEIPNITDWNEYYLDSANFTLNVIGKTSGTFANVPTSNIEPGFAYFATDKGVAGVGAMIYYTGNNSTPWVYSDGTAVS